jgi:hypothetical protein
VLVGAALLTALYLYDQKHNGGKGTAGVKGRAKQAVGKGSEPKAPKSATVSTTTTSTPAHVSTPSAPATSVTSAGGVPKA